jgi:nucleoside-triphosphatase THEP1
LNEEQNEAVRKVFMNHLTFVKGPPGCGKTKTVSRMVKMLAERGMKVLVGSVSNIANQTLIN